ncbi:hypothetical protein PI126_g21879 [Phytophthora idaei]|nr:hypothetical protein PI126_g21879 [Phytophthora idaei]
MTDTAVHEKDVLCEMFPQATQLLCQWHVVMWLKKQAARLAKPVNKEVKALMSLLVYEKNEQDTLTTLQEYAEEQYIADYNRVGGRPSGLNEDPERVSLALQISEFALNLVSEEHALATGPDVDCTVNMGSADTAVVRVGDLQAHISRDSAESLQLRFHENLPVAAPSRAVRSQQVQL